MSNITPDRYRNPSPLSFEGFKSLTEQSHAPSCDIHTIMRKYRRDAVLDHVSQYKGTYADFAQVPDFREAHTIIAEANSMFETVPSHIRADFENDPIQYIAFMQDPDNVKAIEAYGLDASHLPAPAPDPRDRREKDKKAPPETTKDDTDKDDPVKE